MKAIESISSATPKIQCQVSVAEEKAVLFLIVILQELRVQTEIIDFGRSASKLLLCSVRKLEEREVCLGRSSSSKFVKSESC